jgi:hypothetical protein
MLLKKKKSYRANTKNASLVELFGRSSPATSQACSVREKGLKKKKGKANAEEA